MKDRKLRQLLSMLPEEEEIARRAARARRRALARLEEPEPARRGWRWAPAAALTVLLVASAAWVSRAWRVDPLVWTPPAPRIASVPAAPLAPAPAPAVRKASRRAAPGPRQERLEMHLVLSDGTRVLWTFDRKFTL